MDEEHIARFWTKVNKIGPVVRPELGNCWIWTAGLRSGYGAFGVHRKAQQAHRLSYELEYGEVPALLRHKCDTRSCVRPDHLEPGTVKDNARDMLERNPNIYILSVDDVVKARRLAAGGKSVDYIKRILKIDNHNALMKAIQGKTFPHVQEPPVQLENIYRPIYNILTEEQYEEIVESLKHSYRGQGRSLAVKYGVDPSMITLIKHGKVKTVRCFV
jgi:hypothetical protein